MSEVSRPIIAITLVLCAVFIPVAFVSGLTGQFYRQFALTIAISTVISAFNSLTLSPALAAVLLKPHDVKPDRLSLGINRLLGGVFSRFNLGFTRTGALYQRALGGALRRTGIALSIYGGLALLTVLGLVTLPQGFIPSQDKQYLVAVTQLPAAASITRTDAVIAEMSRLGLQQPGVAGAVAFSGLSSNNFVNSSNVGIVFFTLDPFEKRGSAALSSGAIAAALNGRLSSIQDAFVGVFPPPPILGLGALGGFKLNVEDRTDQGAEALYRAVQEVTDKAAHEPALAHVLSNYQINVPQLSVVVDRARVKQQGVALTDVFATLQTYLGSLYVNDFNRFGRTYKVVAQADAPFRMGSDDIRLLKTRNAAGAMVPLGSVLTVKDSFGPDLVERFNAFRSADINAAPAPGYSSGEAQAAIARILDHSLPAGMSYEWTDLAYQEHAVGSTTLLVFVLCVVLVFLVMAAQYESFMLPLAIILIVPMSLLAGMIGVRLQGGDSNVFTQIGFLVLVALACKNAILIVEFAKHLQDQGREPLAAVMEAARLRLRPILMTSFAFIMGVVPLVMAHGAGSEVRHAMGAVVFAGMIGVTVFGLLLTPVFYLLVRGRRAQIGQLTPEPTNLPAEAAHA